MGLFGNKKKSDDAVNPFVGAGDPIAEVDSLKGDGTPVDTSKAPNDAAARLLREAAAQAASSDDSAGASDSTSAGDNRPSASATTSSDASTPSDDSQIDTTIKEAEAATEGPKEELLDPGDMTATAELVGNPEPIPANEADAPSDPSTVKRPEPVKPPVPQRPEAPKRAEPRRDDTKRPEAPKPEAKTLEVIESGNGDEFNDLVRWVKIDTQKKTEVVARRIDGLNDRIRSINDSLEKDTAGLNDEAKTVFAKNTRENIHLIEGQINLEKGYQRALEQHRNNFVADIEKALERYNKPPRANEKNEGERKA